MNRSAALLLFGFPVFFLGVGVYFAIQALMSPPKDDSIIRVSPETTLVTEHIEEDGFVNYESAINQMALKQIPADSNAAIGLLKAFDPTVFPEHVRLKYFEVLGIDEQAFNEVKPFLSYKDNYAIFYADDPEILQRAETSPWKREDQEFERVNSWLESHRDSVQIARQAIEMPQFYFPLFRETRNESLLKLRPIRGRGGRSESYYLDPYGSKAAFLGKALDLARYLNVSAMRAIGENNTQTALYDSMLIRTLARKLSHGGTLGELTISYLVEDRALQVESQLFNMAADQIEGSQLKRYRDQLRELEPRARLHDVIDKETRLLLLDWVNQNARQTQSNDEMKIRRRRFDLMTMFKKLDIDFNAALAQVHRRMDEFVAATELPTTVEQMQAVESSDLPQFERPSVALATSLFASSRTSRGKLLGDLICSLGLNPLKATLIDEARLIAFDRMTDIALTLRADSLNGNALPTTLSSEMATSPFDASPLQYESNGEGFEISANEPLAYAETGQLFPRLLRIVVKSVP